LVKKALKAKESPFPIAPRCQKVLVWQHLHSNDCSFLVGSPDRESGVAGLRTLLFYWSRM